ncbi:hypothetical protein V5O48_012894 [Marasmius crinis-equi]|uniref:Uncharacterized protein n=1 Tax=Marasmius crinis-equi TaxID=585013 RepID=A0ABR3F1K2_9AGAR
MSEYLRNARDFSIGDNSNLSTVQGDQHIYYNQIKIGRKSRRKRFAVETEEEEERLAEYRDVRLGNIVIGKELGSRAGKRFDYDKLEWVSVGCERKIFAAVILSEVGKVTSTIVSYHGPGKEEVWVIYRPWLGTEDAPNLGVEERLQPVLRGFVQLGCQDNALWLDSSRGVLCRGPEGPHCSIRYFLLDSDLPTILSDGKLLQHDAFVQYLATLRQGSDLDRKVVVWLSFYPFTFAKTGDMRVDRPTIISSLTNTTIAMADAGMTSIWARESSCLGEREVLSDGLIRFTLKHCGRRLQFDWIRDQWYEIRHAWMAQSPMAFHPHGIPPEGNLSKYDLIVLDASEGTFSRSRTKRQRRQKCAPIYLFVCPFLASTFWSFKEDGHPPIPDDLCKYLGLPVKISLKRYQYTFSIQSCKAMRDYQILRGFDPTTADFARHCGFHDYEFHVVQPSLAVAATSGRFEDLEDSDFVVIECESTEDTYLEESLPLLFGEVPPDSSEMPELAPSSSTFWSRLASSFS